MPPPLAVVFDLDDTLCDATGAMLTALEAVSLRTPAFADRSPAELHALQIHVMQGLDAQIFSGALNASQARTRRFELMLSACGDPAPDGASAALAYREVYRASFRQTRGAGQLLKALREGGLRIGVLTNYLREVQQETLEAIGLSPLVDALVTVSDAPPKPHLGSYAAICKALDVTPDRAVMVGDSWANDVAGAVSAGLRAVWYAPVGQQAPADVPHRRLNSYEPLQQALEVILG